MKQLGTRTFLLILLTRTMLIVLLKNFLYSANTAVDNDSINVEVNALIEGISSTCKVIPAATQTISFVVQTLMRENVLQQIILVIFLKV